MKHPEKQLPYIDKVLKRIQQEYNQKAVWKKIWKQILFE
jgi:hypothetical protein